jgi:hypothetical protein
LEGADVVTRLSVLGQVGHDFTHDAAELETVPGKSRGNARLRTRRMSIKHKVFVRRIGVHARDGFQAAAIE